MEDSDSFQTWWEIPSIVHLCNTLSTCIKDIYPISIERFEEGLNDNSNILMNIAIRFVKVCGFYESKSNKWWDFMKLLLKNHCPVYDFENPLGDTASFNELSSRKKVEVLYILGHLVLDVEKVQQTLSCNFKVLKKLNVKPLGYDVNKSVYWYFGGTRLYREDYDVTYLPDNILELFSSESNETVTSSNEQNNSSCDVNDASNLIDHSSINNPHSYEDIQKQFKSNPYISGILGSGKWNLICDDDESWHYLSDTTEYSRNINVKILHRSLNKIIHKLPILKKHKPIYKFVKYDADRPKPPLKKVRSRLLLPVQRVTRSKRGVGLAFENNHFDDSKNKNNDEIAKKDKFGLKTLQVVLTRIDLDSRYSSMINMNNLKENMPISTKLKFKNTNRLLRSRGQKLHEGLEFNRTKKYQIDKEVIVERCGQENVQSIKLKVTKNNPTQKRFHTHAEMQVSPLKDITRLMLI